MTINSYTSLHGILPSQLNQCNVVVHLFLKMELCVASSVMARNVLDHICMGHTSIVRRRTSTSFAINAHFVRNRLPTHLLQIGTLKLLKTMVAAPPSHPRAMRTWHLRGLPWRSPVAIWAVWSPLKHWHCTTTTCAPTIHCGDMEALKRTCAEAAKQQGGAESSSKNARTKKTETETRKEMQEKTSMAVVALESRLRAVESVCFEVTMVKATHQIPHIMKGTNDTYNTSLKEAGSKKARAEIRKVQRHYFTFAECAAQYIAALETAEGIDKLPLLQYAQSIVATPIMLRSNCKYFRRLRPNKDGMCKIVACICGKECVALYTMMKQDMLREEGTVVYDGQAPKGHACRDITRCLVDLGLWSKFDGYDD